MTEMVLRELLVTLARRAYERGLVGGTGGNFSARIDGEKMLITASGLSLTDTSINNLITVEIETCEWEPVEGFIPSKEFRFHADILKIRSDVGAILHVHAPYATAYSVLKRDIPMITDAGFKQPPIPRVPFAPSGTEELRHKVAQTVRDNLGCRSLLLEQHGVIALGKDIIAAYNQADLVEELAKIAYLSDNLHGKAA